MWVKSHDPSNPDEWIYTTSKYDDLGRLIESYYDDTVANGTPYYTSSKIQQKIDYDANGRQEKVWEYIGDTDRTATKYGYDSQVRMTTTELGYTDAEAGLEFQFDYDTYGNTTKFTNPKSKERTKFYDNKGRLVREFSPKCCVFRKVRSETKLLLYLTINDKKAQSSRSKFWILDVKET